MANMMAKFAPLLALGLVAVPVTANAQTNTAEVSYRDLDLTRLDHQERLNRRITGAVTEVCGRTSPSTLALNNAITACRTTAMRAAHNGVRVAIARAEQKQRAFASNQAPVVGN